MSIPTAPLYVKALIIYSLLALTIPSLAKATSHQTTLASTSSYLHGTLKSLVLKEFCTYFLHQTAPIIKMFARELSGCFGFFPSRKASTQSTSGSSSESTGYPEAVYSFLKSSGSGDGSGDGDGQSPESFEITVEEVDDAYFMFRQDLKTIREQLQRLRAPLILSFDIDGTILPSKSASVMDKDRFQIFDEWLHRPASNRASGNDLNSLMTNEIAESVTEGQQDSEEMPEVTQSTSLEHNMLPILLILNTGRRYPDSSAFSNIKTQGLPQPHILIHYAGAKVLLNSGVLAEQYFLNEFSGQINQLSQRLTENFTKNNDSFLKYWRVNDLSLFGKVVEDKNDSNFYQYPYVFFNSHRAHKLKFFFTGMLEEDKTIRKNFTVSRHTGGLFLFDTQVNKGSALVLTLTELTPKLPDNVLLYSAGDSLPDLAMLFPEHLSDAYRKPERRDPEKVRDDLLELGVTGEHFKKVAQMHRASIVPKTMSYSLKERLKASGLKKHPKLHRIEKAGLTEIMAFIAEDLASIEVH